LFLTNSGDVSISLNALENFENEINVYLYDLENNIYTLLNDTDFNENLTADNYLNRYYITLSNTVHYLISSDNQLSTNDSTLNDISVWHSKLKDLLYVNGLESSTKTRLSLFNIEGKKLIEENITNESYALNTSQIPTGIYIV
jgi:hypothetical protein